MLADPPFSKSAAFVTILMEPPTDGTANLDAPSPLCTCNLLVTSERPAQLDQ